MLPLYRIIEITFYALLNFLPYLILALYPFRNRLRFSRPVTILLISVLTLLQVTSGFLAVLLPHKTVGMLSALNTAAYFIFYLVSVKAHFGKILFTLLMLSNISNLIVVISKCVEGILAPGFATQPYRWSYSGVMLLVQLVVLIPLYLYTRHFFTQAVEKDTQLSAWKYLWLIPATFYLLWFYHLYANTQSALEIALQPKHAVFLLCINLGAFLIYHMVVCLINVYDKNTVLKNQNHQLTLQKLQYENLKDKILETRRAKHDIRHHIAVMAGYLQDKKYDELETYLAGYQSSFPDNSSVILCKNYTVNLLLLYFVEQAKAHNISFSVLADIPEKISIAENDLSVLLGNLIENAIDACLNLPEAQRHIIIRAKLKDNALVLTIDNPYEGEPKRNKNGEYLSSKHDGIGLGIESARQITLHYNGTFLIEQKNGMFFVSVLLNLPD